MGAMNGEQDHGNAHRHRSHSLLGPAAVLYGALMAVAVLWRYLAGRSGPFTVNPVRSAPLIEAAVVAVVFLLHVLLDLYGPRLSRSIARMFSSLQEVLGRISPAEAAALAALSAFGEEAFFRGTLQPALGFWPALLIFALSHFPARRELLLWPLYALLVGLALGYLVVLAGDIWSAVLLHFLINLFSLLYMSRQRQRQEDGDTSGA